MNAAARLDAFFRDGSSFTVSYETKWRGKYPQSHAPVREQPAGVAWAEVLRLLNLGGITAQIRRNDGAVFVALPQMASLFNYSGPKKIGTSR